MIRYNAAHRGAETDVFPVTDEAGVPMLDDWRGLSGERVCRPS
jgi:hypothetical protein